MKSLRATRWKLGPKMLLLQVCLRPLPMVQNYADMLRWVQANSQFNSEAKADFAQVADGWLCSYAKANAQHVGVTHEELSPQAKRRVPIPSLCQEFGLDYADPFAMLKDLQVRFRWSA